MPASMTDLSRRLRTERVAYALYIERGSAAGDDLGDWVQAEDRIRSLRAAWGGSARVFSAPYVLWAEQRYPKS